MAPVRPNIDGYQEVRSVYEVRRPYLIQTAIDKSLLLLLVIKMETPIKNAPLLVLGKDDAITAEDVCKYLPGVQTVVMI